jgi:hypothetical protein
MNHTNRVALLGLTVVSLVLNTAFAAVTLPFVDNFETYTPPGSELTTAKGWAFGAGTTTIMASGLDGQNVRFTNSLSLNVDVTKNYSNAMLQVYCKPAYMDTVPATATGSTVACSFYIDSDGDLNAVSNNQWVVVGTGFTTNWIGFGAHLDFASGTWDLYYTTSGYNTDMTKANSGGPLKMNVHYAGGNCFSNLSITSEAQMQIDAVLASAQYHPVGANTEETVVRHDQVVSNGVEIAMILLGNNFLNADNTLAGSPFSQYLFSLLEPGDTIRLLIPGQGTCEYTVDTDGVSWDPGYTGPNPSTVHVTSGMAVILVPNSTRTIYGFAFPDPNNVVGTVVAGTANASWSLLVWPRSGSSTVNVGANRWGFGGGVAAGGDTVYLRDKDNPGDYFVIFWSPATGTWRMGKDVAAGVVMKHLQTFSYRRFAAGDGTWLSGSAQ